MRSLSGFRALYVVGLVLSDLVMLRLAFVLAYHLRIFSDVRPDQPSEPPSTYSRAR